MYNLDNNCVISHVVCTLLIVTSDQSSIPTALTAFKYHFVLNRLGQQSCSGRSCARAEVVEQKVCF